ncbi:Lrp/AsnC family transcriptional regulator [Aquisalimonas sp.]|uniref:Lrp/AsnC family transcriptional regulator n=1 Tax=Aquisalimonas sp. TaxID=1872621 RepID=UPI0025C516D5|nr:Lrp/AsnC family transcriptional regulator [Aquisalimonas sp.]
MASQRDSEADVKESHQYGELERALLNDYQRGLPLVSRPFAEIGKELGVGEEAVLAALGEFQGNGVVSRVGATLKPGAIGVGTLAAMAVPEDDIERVAAIISARPEVNHNYEREHDFNLWFVAMAPDQSQLLRALADIETCTGYPLLDLRLVCDYHVDLGFDLQWASQNAIDS